MRGVANKANSLASAVKPRSTDARSLETPKQCHGQSSHHLASEHVCTKHFARPAFNPPLTVRLRTASGRVRLRRHMTQTMNPKPFFNRAEAPTCTMIQTRECLLRCPPRATPMGWHLQQPAYSITEGLGFRDWAWGSWIEVEYLVSSGLGVLACV